MGGTTVGSIVAKLMLNIDNFSSNLSTVQNEIQNTGKKLDGLSNLGSGITSVGKTLTTSLTLPIVGIGTAAATTAANFEAGMSKVQAISGATGDDFDALEAKALELGASTKYSASEVADAMTDMAKAGWSSQQIVDGMGGVLDAAAASGEDLASVSTIVADAITGFGLAASDSARVADLLTQAANAGTIDITDLGESFKYIAPLAASLGFDIEEATAAIAAMSTAGIKGSQAGTSLKNMLTNLVKPTDPMIMAMEELGISVTDSAGNMKSLDDILANLRSSFAGLTEAEKAKYAATLAGKEGMSGMLALVNMSQGAYDDLTTSMLNSGGVAQETANVMLDNLSGQLTILKSSLESLMISIGNTLLPTIKKITEVIQDVVTKLNGLSEEQKEQLVKVAAVVAAIGPLLLVVGKLINAFVAVGKAISAVKTALPLIQAAIAGISWPVVAVVAAIGLLVGAFVTLWKTNEEFRNKMTEIWNQVKGAFDKLFGGIVERLNQLGFDFKSITDVIWSIWKGFCDLLGPQFQSIFEYIALILDTAVGVILGILDIFIGIFTGNWDQAWEGIKGIFMSIWNYIVGWFEILWTNTVNTINVILGWFGTSWEECWNGIKTFFVNIWNGIVTWFQGILTGISTFFTNVWTGITTFFTNVITGIANFVQTNFGGLFTNIQNIFNAVKDYFVNVWEIVKNIFLGAILLLIDLVTGDFESLKSDLANIWENIKNAFSNIWEAIKTIFVNVIEAIKNYTTGTMDAIKTIFTTVWNAIKTFFTNAVNNIKTTAVNTFSNMKTGISNVISNIKTTIVNGFNKAIDWIKALPSQAITWGKDMIQGIVDGIKAMIGKVEDAVKGVADKIRSFLHFSVPDEGPLRDYQTWMPDMVDGLTSTLNKAAPNLFRAAETIASGLANAFNNEDLQPAIAGAYGSISSGTHYSTPSNSTEAVRNAKSGGTINIEKIEVRDDDDIEELTQGLYNHNDKSLRAMGRRNL